MSTNINTRNYWEERFSSGDWESKKGRWQTENFARGQVRLIDIGRDFSGTILDFGCGLGDAIPIYKENFPQATLQGIDISQNAVDSCRKEFGSIAEFVQGDHTVVPEVDVIIASNVLEHLTNDMEIAKLLLSKCRILFIIVPYRQFPLCLEHVNRYDENSFKSLDECNHSIFPCVGWTQFGLKDLWYQVYFKNIFRLLLGRTTSRRDMQIIFKIKNSKYNKK